MYSFYSYSFIEVSVERIMEGAEFFEPKRESVIHIKKFWFEYP